MKKKFILVVFFAIVAAKLFGQTDGLYWDTDYTIYPNNLTMNVIIFVEGEEQRNENVEIAAFCGDELRGNIRTKHITGTNPTYGDIDSYLAYLTVNGNDGDIITFKLYDHNTETEYEMLSNETITFETNIVIGTAFDPFHLTFTIPHPNNTFTGSGSWNDASNWENSKVPTEKSIVTIDGDALITDNITVYSLSINETKSLTIKDGGVLTVNETLTNAEVNALIIEEGGQLIHHNEGVAATFKNEIEVPAGTWGEEDNTGWQFISSPVNNVNVNDFVPANGDYDLYMYDGTQELQWINFKLLGSQSYDFSTDPFNNGWTAIDADGDGLNWEYDDRDGFMTSYSYYDREDIYADNYLVSPQIMVNESTLLSFKAYVTYDRVPETFKVLLSTSNKNVEDFTETLGQGEYSIDNEDAETFTIDLSEFAGQNVYVAFYHYLADDARAGSEQLIIDDVEFVNENSFEKGRGYLVSYQNEDNVAEFKGNLNYLDEGESYQIDFNHYPNILAQFNLIGNPFPFNIDWDEYVETSSVYDGFATLNAEEGGYKYNVNGTIKAGEGFMIKTLEGVDQYIRFSRNTSKSYRTKYNSINITVSNKTSSDNVIIRFNDEKASGFPKLLNFNNNIAAVYVKDENINYGILNYNNDIKEIPLYFDAKEMGTYTLTFDFEGNYDNLYLLDKMTGEKVNVLLENKYSFTATSNDNPDRFVLRLAQSSQPEAHSHFAYINNSDIVIFDIEGEAQIRIIDALGRCVYNGECSDEIHRVDAASHVLTSGVYMIQKIDDKGINIQKIIID